MHNTSFDSTKTRLEDILKDIQEGRIQLPDFQRDWVWDDERVVDILTSVALSFPIGSIMLLETGDDSIRFMPRPFSNVVIPPDARPEKLVLDGQQRLTALYQALFAQHPVQTRDSKRKAVKRRYYFDMRKAVSGNEFEELVISVPEDGRLLTFGGEVSLDLSSPEKEYQNCYFPTNQVFSSNQWRREYYSSWNHSKEAADLWDEFERRIIDRLKVYMLPVIKLERATPKEAICLIFERVNTGGIVLNVFELLTASFAADDFHLREDWEKRRQVMQNSPGWKVLEKLQSDQFLQTVALLVTQERRRQDHQTGISCKRKDILNLTVADWQKWADRALQGYLQAAQFLYSQKILKQEDLPYQTQLVPLAAVFADLGDEAKSESARQKIARWYWCGVFGELYGSSIESRFARDVPELIGWIRGSAAEPTTVQEASFAPDRLFTLRTRNSAAYKGLYALLMRNGCKDFLSGETVEEQSVFNQDRDVHHIFPQRWCEQHRINSLVYNCIINKTVLSSRTNRKIGGHSPSRYLKDLEKAAGISEQQMDEILETHCITPGYLRADDFHSFIRSRAELLIKQVEEAMGKSIPYNPITLLDEKRLASLEAETDEQPSLF